MVRKKDVVLFLAGIGVCKLFSDKLCLEKDYENEKNYMLIDFFNRWMTLRERGITVDRFLKEKGYRKVAIYGLGMIGNHLYEELRNTEVEVIGIDKANIYNNFRMEIYKPDQCFDDVDLIIVTPLQYKEICQSMKGYRGAFISFQQLLNKCEEYLYTMYG